MGFAKFDKFVPDIKMNNALLRLYQNPGILVPSSCAGVCGLRVYTAAAGKRSRAIRSLHFWLLKLIQLKRQ